MLYRKLYIVTLLIFLFSCTKEERNTTNTQNDSTATSSNLSSSYSSNGLTANRFTFVVSPKDYPLYDPRNTGGLSGGVDQATNGTLLYSYQNIEHLIINPNKNKGIYTSPIHFLNSNSLWKLESGNYGMIMDMPRNMVKVENGIYAWANQSVEDNITGNAYISKTGLDNTISWQKLSNKDGFYHYITTGDIDNNGTTEILTYKGAELGRPELFEVYNSSGNIYSNTSLLPSLTEFENITGAKDFSFGSIIISNIDTTNSVNELILTSSRNVMNLYFSFIVLAYNKQLNKFEIKKIIKPNGALKDYNLAVADIKVGNFNQDNLIDIAVSMGQGVDDKTGIQIWYGDGIGGLTPGKKSIFTSSDLINFSNFEIGKYNAKNVDDIFLHFSGKFPAVPTTTNGLDLNKFFLINDGNRDTPFKNPTSLILPFSTMALDKTTNQIMFPSFIKGYFINNKLRMIGFRGRLDMYGNNNTNWSGYNEFDLYDLTF